MDRARIPQGFETQGIDRTALEREADQLMRTSGIKGADEKSRYELTEAQLAELDELTEVQLAELDELASSMIDSLAKILIGSSSLLRTLSQGELVVLLAVKYHDGEPTPMDLSREVALTRPRITQILDALEKKGMVERRRDDHDQRRVRVSLTEEGEVRTTELMYKMAALIKNHLMLLGEDDSRAFARILQKTADVTYGFSTGPTNEFLAE